MADGQGGSTNRPSNDNSQQTGLLRQILEAITRVVGPGGGSPGAAPDTAANRLGGSQGGGDALSALAGRLGISAGRRGINVQGVAGQAMVAGGLGGARAALGRAGIAGLALNSGLAYGAGGAASANRAISGQSLSSFETLQRTNVIYNAANNAVSTLTNGLINPFAGKIAGASAAGRIDTAAEGIIGQFQSGARAIGVPLSQSETNSVAAGALAYSAGLQDDFVNRRRALQSFGASKANLIGDLRAQQAENAKDPGIFGNLQIDQARAAIISSDEKNTELIRETKRQTALLRDLLRQRSERGNR